MEHRWDSNKDIKLTAMGIMGLFAMVIRHCLFKARRDYGNSNHI